MDDIRDLLALHQRALDEFARRVHAVKPDQWHCSTPCAEWEVRHLVNHLVVEQLWVPPLLAGQTIAEVGDAFAGDRLGDDPVGAWDRAAAAARAAFAADDALARTVHLSYGDRPALEYLQEMIFDLVVHAWDLARGIDGDEHLPEDLVDAVYSRVDPDAGALTASGLFAEPVAVDESADEQARLIALTGRRP